MRAYEESLQMPGRYRRRRLSEVEIVQNPALGAQLIWAAASSHVKAGSAGLRVDVCFLILPLVLRVDTQQIIKGTQPSSGLAKFVLKLESSRDLLLALHGRALEQRELTLQSLATGVLCKLFTIESEHALVIPQAVRKQLPAPSEVRPLIQSAERLGVWFAQLSPSEVMAILRVLK